MPKRICPFFLCRAFTNQVANFYKISVRLQGSSAIITGITFHALQTAASKQYCGARRMVKTDAQARMTLGKISFSSFRHGKSEAAASVTSMEISRGDA